MAPTDTFYYVFNGVITTPPSRTVFSQGCERTAGPFPRPDMVGSIRFAKTAADEDLAPYGAYRLHIEERGSPPSPEYLPVTGELVVDTENHRVTRTDSWREPTTEEHTAYNKAVWAQQAQARKDREAQSALAEPDSENPAVLKRKLNAALHLLNTRQ